MKKIISFVIILGFVFISIGAIAQTYQVVDPNSTITDIDKQIRITTPLPYKVEIQTLREIDQNIRNERRAKTEALSKVSIYNIGLQSLLAKRAAIISACNLDPNKI